MVCINNLTSNLINRIEIKWEIKSILNINNCDVLSTYQESTNQRANSVRSDIQSNNL